MRATLRERWHQAVTAHNSVEGGNFAFFVINSGLALQSYADYDASHVRALTGTLELPAPAQELTSCPDFVPLADSSTLCHSRSRWSHRSLPSPAARGSTGSFGKRDSGVPAFNPDGGLPPFDPDGGTVGSGTGATTGVTGASTGSSGTFVTGAGSSQTTTSQGASTTSMVIPSSGVLITVEPDGSGDAKPLLTAIENAKVAVHMEIYLLTNDTYINALEGLSKNIDVKVLLNQTFPSGSSAAETNVSSYPTLQNAGVNVKWAPADPNRSEAGYTHEKAVIIDPGTDGEQVWIMTMNLDNSALRYNREYLAQDTNSGDVVEAEQIFEADFAGSSPNRLGRSGRGPCQRRAGLALSH